MPALGNGDKLTPCRFTSKRFANLERRKNLRMGTYLMRYMTLTAQATRIIGKLVTVFAAWIHSARGIGAGLLIVIAAWSYALLLRARNEN